MVNFLKKIDDSGDCWEWKGAKQARINGYGVWGRKDQIFLAHRVSFELFKGKIPKDMELDHLCKNKYCVNPNHLEIVTHKENNRRRIIHNPRAKPIKTEPWHKLLSLELLKKSGTNEKT